MSSDEIRSILYKRPDIIEFSIDDHEEDPFIRFKRNIRSSEIDYSTGEVIDGIHYEFEGKVKDEEDLMHRLDKSKPKHT